MVREVVHPKISLMRVKVKTTIWPDISPSPCCGREKTFICFSLSDFRFVLSLSFEIKDFTSMLKRTHTRILAFSRTIFLLLIFIQLCVSNMYMKLPICFLCVVSSCPCLDLDSNLVPVRPVVFYVNRNLFYISFSAVEGNSSRKVFLFTR